MQSSPEDERLDRLEREVAELRAALARSGVARVSRPRLGLLERLGIQYDFRLESQHWLNKVGIGLVLFGVGFLFKYSIDMGWLTEWVRVAIGLALATLLLALGLTLYPRQRRFSQVLIGGGFGTLYLTAFAAFQLFGLVGYLVAFGFMATVTGAAYTLALRQQDAGLSLVATIGAFGTPFLLYDSSAAVPGLVGYLAILILGTGALYARRGWRSVLWVASVGGWAALGLAVAGWNSGPSDPRWLVQATIALAWGVFWCLPLARESAIAAGRAPPGVSVERTPRRTARTRLLGVRADLARLHIHLLSVTAPLTALALMQHLWSWSTTGWGYWMIGMAALHGLVAAVLVRRLPGMAGTQASASAILLAIGFLASFDGDVLMLALAAQALAVHRVGRWLGGWPLVAQGHLTFGALAGWMLLRLLMDAVPPIAVNTRALVDLAVLSTGYLAARSLRRREDRHAYLIGTHVLLLGWIWRELAALPSGQAFVTIVWGAYALLLLGLGLRRDIRPLQTAALLTLLLPVVKLFAVDLQALAAPWRILLFLGFGGAFLALSYLLQVRWKSADPR